MTNPNNGATLEDCHSNFFALTDLCGIKWRRLVWDGVMSSVGHGHHSFGPLDDPVLSSFARCLAADVLCVWRRSPPTKNPSTPIDPFHGTGHFMNHGPPNPMMQSPHGLPPNMMHPHMNIMGQSGHVQPHHMSNSYNIHQNPIHPSQINSFNPPTLNGPKELWLFWYGDEPDLSTLVNPQLLKTEAEQGSWESGLSYECRSLLFKALHNLIERCLLARDFLRIGKWFIQPSDDISRLGVKKIPIQLSFSFTFFVHGESTVCMSVDVRQHPPIRRVVKHHISSLATSNYNVPVILAPHGLSATLTGVGYRMNDPGTHKILEEWKQFYPVEEALKSSLYDSSPHSFNQGASSSSSGSYGIPPVLEVVVGGPGGVRMRYPACYVLSTDMDDIPKINETRGTAMNHKSNLGYSIDSSEPTTNPKAPISPTQEVEKLKCLLQERVWQESMLCPTPEPTVKLEADSSRSNEAPENQESLGKWDFTDPTIKRQCSCSGSSRPKKIPGGKSWSKNSTKIRKKTFHRRNIQQLSAADSWSKIWDLKEDIALNATIISNSSTNPTPIVQNKGNEAQNNRVGPVSFSPLKVVGGNESSPIPSPLPTPLSHPSVQHINNQQSAPPTTVSPQSVTISSEPTKIGPSDYTLSPALNCYDREIKTEKEGSTGEESSFSRALSQTNNVSEMSSQQIRQVKGFKRPVLPCREYEAILAEESLSQPSDIIYDYSGLEGWSHLSNKRVRLSVSNKGTNSYNSSLGMKKPEISSNQGVNVYMSGNRHNDPYEFNDENLVPHGAKNIKNDSNRSSCFHERESDRYDRKPDLYTASGLLPSLSDLNQIMADDESVSSGDDDIINLQPTPPGSNKPNSIEDSIHQTTVKHKSNLGILRPEELSKMFPTPPSHEHNPISSPCGLPDTPIMEIIGDSCHRRIQHSQENYIGLGSPTDEGIETRIESFSKLGNKGNDWSYVYKPPPISRMLGSSKYAPLPFLSTQSLQHITIYPNSTYKPTWQFPPTKPIAPQPSQHQFTNIQHHQNTHMLMGPTIPSQVHLRPGLSPISPVPSSIRGGPTFELGSPISSNMYLKQGSVLQHAHGPQSHHAHMYGSRGLEAHALVVNLSLSDSVINLFRDHNFDSCTMCVCNAGNRVVGNIRGSEVGTYIPDLSPEEDSVSCNCGFSASVNRRLAHRAGLFYEDEYEITTPALASLVLLSDEWYEKKKPSFLLLDAKYPNPMALANDKSAVATSAIIDDVPTYLLEMLKEQCLLVFGTTTASRFTGEVINHKFTERTYNFLEYLDGNRAALTALEHGRTVMLEATGRSTYPRLPEDSLPLKHNLHFMHKWPYLWARGPHSSQDVMLVMKALLPLLQDAVHAKAWDAQYNVSGPLTWRQFHRLAGRGTDDRCEPQPIPSVLVGSEKDWVALSPLAIKFWEKLLLEPYAYPRDVGYIVICPDNDFIISKARTFFRDLSTMYETCQLGKHIPIFSSLRDGFLRVGKKSAKDLASHQVDDWFNNLPDIPTATTLKLYAQVCKFYLVPKLSEITLDLSTFDIHNNKSASSPKMAPPNLDSSASATPPQGPPTPKNDTELSSENINNKDGGAQEPIDDERDPPALVVYLIEPFGFGSDNKDLHRLASLGLLRCFTSVQMSIPENIRNNITLQVISLEDIMNIGNSSLDNRNKNDQMRDLSLTIYSQCRRLLIHQNGVRSLTGFGPAAASELFLKSKDIKKKESYRLYTPPYVLAPIKEKVTEGVDWLGSLQSVGGMVSSGTSLSAPISPSSSSVLYIAYCISEDHRWLLASATDDRGELVETSTISIYVPNRSKRRKASARRHGLSKLMDFIIGIMSTGIQPWRLVIGRLGRVGHGELESWSSLLSRKSLLRVSNHLKDACRQCSLQYPFDSPCVLSACLVSLEPDSCLRLMPDQFTPDERFGVTSTAAASTGSSTLSTPHDVSCTHILVFPTSATTQSSQKAFEEQHINCPDMDEEDLLFGEGDITDGIDGMPDLQLNDIFSWEGPGVTSPAGSPRRDSSSQPGSPGGIGASGRQSPFQGTGKNRTDGRGDGNDELGTVLQQPLALGYLVSTAPAGNLPPWFWASCPQRASEKGTGVFLKSALHLHSHSVLHNSDDLFPQQASAKQHPLDSQYTTDVLRFVLEGYNALSWLSLDSKSHDRKSCLPVHVQKLLQLYFTISTLV